MYSVRVRPSLPTNVITVVESRCLLVRLQRLYSVRHCAETLLHLVLCFTWKISVEYVLRMVVNLVPSARRSSIPRHRRVVCNLCGWFTNSLTFAFLIYHKFASAKGCCKVSRYAMRFVDKIDRPTQPTVPRPRPRLRRLRRQATRPQAVYANPYSLPFPSRCHNS